MSALGGGGGGLNIVLGSEILWGEIIYPPLFGQKASFRGGGGGVYFGPPLRQEFVRPHSFIRPLHP